MTIFYLGISNINRWCLIFILFFVFLLLFSRAYRTPAKTAPHSPSRRLPPTTLSISSIACAAAPASSVSENITARGSSNIRSGSTITEQKAAFLLSTYFSSLGSTVTCALQRTGLTYICLRDACVANGNR